MTKTSIAVVGAGPVGLAAAALLADIGHDVTLIAPAAPPDRRTSALLAGSVALLERLGVWGELAPTSAPLRTMRIVDGTQRLIRAPEVAFEAGEIGLPAFGYNIANAALVAALEAAVAARRVRRVDALADTVSFSADDVTITASKGEPITARLVVAADGRRSKLRDAAGIVAQEWRYPQSALVCNLAHTLPHHDASTEFHTEHGPFTLVPLPGNRSSLVWVDAPDETRRRLEASETDVAEEIERRSASMLGKITIEGARQAFPLSGMSVRQLAKSRVMLVGEAAHVFPPIGAQGLNLGYRDVAALGEVLAAPADDPGSADALAAYERSRRVDVMSRTAAVDALNRTLLSDFLPASALRGLGLFLVDRVPPLRRFAMRQGLAAV
jgi:2-octaprenyl-6-methoxyphenol hydroxylase